MPGRTTWEGPERRRILALVNAVPASIEAKDRRSILEIYDTHDAKFCTFEDDPHYAMRVDGRQFRSFIESVAELDSSSIDRKDVRVDFLSKSVALVTGFDDWEATTKKGKTTKARSRFTIVFWRRKRKKKKGRGWRVIHEHFTRLE